MFHFLTTFINFSYYLQSCLDKFATMRTKPTVSTTCKPEKIFDKEESSRDRKYKSNTPTEMSVDQPEQSSSKRLVKEEVSTAIAYHQQ